MKTLIVADSYFGNTEQIARSMADALGADTQVVKPAEAAPGLIAAAERLLVGSPTRGFRPSEATVRFLRALPRESLRGKEVGAFDTGIPAADIPAAGLRTLARIFGYAAKPIAKALVKKGGTLAAPPAGFWVKDTKGPLAEGELRRAADWARGLDAARR